MIPIPDLTDRQHFALLLLAAIFIGVTAGETGPIPTPISVVISFVSVFGFERVHARVITGSWFGRPSDPDEDLGVGEARA